MSTTIECAVCGAPQLTSDSAAGYRCDICGTSRAYRRCPSCETVVALEGVNGRGQLQCPFCGESSPLSSLRISAVMIRVGAAWNSRRNQAVASDYARQSARNGQPEPSDPDQRLVRGVVEAASGVPGLTPGHLCIVRFRADDVAVFVRTPDAFREVQMIQYHDVDALDISGQRPKTATRDAGIIGGGFGIEGAVEGMVMASAINALTRRTTTVFDTVVLFKAAGREMLLSTDGLSPAALQVVLAPVYGKIKRANRGATTRRGAASKAPPPPAVPAGWYPDPDRDGVQRYWDGQQWTGDTAPLV